MAKLALEGKNTLQGWGEGKEVGLGGSRGRRKQVSEPPQRSSVRRRESECQIVIDGTLPSKRGGKGVWGGGKNGKSGTFKSPGS